MEKKIINFIIKHFGCYTLIEGKDVLTSLATMSFVPIEEFWNVFSGDAEKYFGIRRTKNKSKLTLILDEKIRKHIEQKLGLR